MNLLFLVKKESVKMGRTKVAKKAFPINLLAAMLGEDSELIDEIISNDDKLNGLEYCISLLADKHRAIVNMFYREGVRAEEIGERFDITKSRVYDIRNDAIRQIHRSENFKYILYGVQGAKLVELKRQKEEEMKFERRKADFPNISFEYLQEYISTRSWNCLWRHSVISRKDFTIGDLERMSDKELGEIRNLGDKCVEDIRYGIEKIKADYGFKSTISETTYSEQFNTVDDIVNALLARIKPVTQDDRNFINAVEQKYKELKGQA
mgnify:CR=1 FL=1